MFGKIKGLAVGNHISQYRLVAGLIFVEPIADAMDQHTRRNNIARVILSEQIIVHFGAVFCAIAQKKIEADNNQTIGNQKIGTQQTRNDGLNPWRFEIRVIILKVRKCFFELIF